MDSGRNAKRNRRAVDSPAGPRYFPAVPRRARWLLLVFGLLLAAGAVRIGRTRSAEAVPPAPAPTPALLTVSPPAPAPPPSLARAPIPAPAPLPAQSSAASPVLVPVVDEGYPINLERLRADIPRNRYWIDSMPTNDPDVLARREADSAGWNRLYGKVLSGTASTDEIRTWVDHRRNVSEDAIEFAQRVLAEYGSELPERDRGLLELAIDMHRTRLAELPRKESEARERKDQQDRARAAWNGAPPP